MALISVGLSSGAWANSEQGRCSSGDNYFDVDFLIYTTKQGLPTYYTQGISVQKTALSMKYSPQWYAVDWEDIDKFQFIIDQKFPDNGKLSIVFKEFIWFSYTFNVGSVTNSCWNDLKKFVIERKIPLKWEVM
jgi:hypothetical protein